MYIYTTYSSISLNSAVSPLSLWKILSVQLSSASSSSQQIYGEKELKEKKSEMTKIGKENLKKERHIVTWSQQEDDVLREEISIHGTENWAIIASKFKDKTTRQCRRRWYTYLNSDFKKGGWSPDEDMLLCEAQRMFGNRWTEIAKVVSGRTDNAVKNRFSTLCKKRAKYAGLEKENDNSLINLQNKRLYTDGLSEATMQITSISGIDNCTIHERSLHKKLRAPFAELIQNIHDGARGESASKTEKISNDAQNEKDRKKFMKQDDPKMFALLQQAELLSSLAAKVNTEKTEQSLEYAWQVLKEFLNWNKENEATGYNILDIELESKDIEDLIAGLQSSSDSARLSAGSTLQLSRTRDKSNQSQTETFTKHHDCTKFFGKYKDETLNRSTVDPGVNLQCVDAVLSEFSNTNIGSSILSTPQFKSFGAGIQSPQFSESEKKFLLRTLGMESPSPNLSSNSSKPPACRRALLQSP